MTTPVGRTAQGMIRAGRIRRVSVWVLACVLVSGAWLAFEWSRLQEYKAEMRSHEMRITVNTRRRYELVRQSDAWLRDRLGETVTASAGSSASVPRNPEIEEFIADRNRKFEEIVAQRQQLRTDHKAEVEHILRYNWVRRPR